MKKIVMLIVVSTLGFSGGLLAHEEDVESHCAVVYAAIESEDIFTNALKEAVFSNAGKNSEGTDGTNGGFDLNMWATVVATDGTVCGVTKTGEGLNDQWLGSRVISAQKANTANAFSLPGLALSTANLWAPTQPGGSLYGLQFSNPVDTETAYAGSEFDFGTVTYDPMVGNRVGGVNVFGGGLALYNSSGDLIGAIGVSGDSSCADHNIAWRVRDALGLDYVPSGVNSDGSDNIIFDLEGGVSPSGWGHPTCGGTTESSVNADIVVTHPIGE